MLINCKNCTRMLPNKKKREDLRRSADAVGKTKLSFKKEKSRIEEVPLKFSFKN